MKDGGYNYEIGICGPAQVDIIPGLENAGVLQIKKHNSKKEQSKPVVIGNFNESDIMAGCKCKLNYYIDPDIMAGCKCKLNYYIDPDIMAGCKCQVIYFNDPDSMTGSTCKHIMT